MPKQSSHKWLCTSVTLVLKVVESSKDLASLVVCNEKKFLVGGCSFFCE